MAKLLNKKKVTPIKLITQDNALIAGKQSFDVFSKKLLLLALTKVFPMADEMLKNNKYIYISVDEYKKECFPYYSEKSEIHQLLKNALLTLQSIVIQVPDEMKKDEENYINIFDKSRRNRKNGSVGILFHRDIIPYISNLSKKDKFTTYNFLDAAQLRNSYQIHIYECIARWSNAGVWFCKYEEMREILNIKKGQYKSNYELFRKIIEPALIEINRNADLEFSVCSPDILKENYIFSNAKPSENLCKKIKDGKFSIGIKIKIIKTIKQKELFNNTSNIKVFKKSKDFKQDSKNLMMWSPHIFTLNKAKNIINKPKKQIINEYVPLFKKNLLDSNYFKNTNYDKLFINWLEKN